MKLPPFLRNAVKSDILSSASANELGDALRTNHGKDMLTLLSTAELYAALEGKLGPNISISIIPKSVARVREDILTWYTALQQAENVTLPRRNNLYRVYDQVLVDNHLSSVIQTRNLRLTGTRWKVETPNGDDPEKAKLLQAPWFGQFLQIAMDSIYWGHSLIEFGPLVNGAFSSCALVNRRHIRPEPGQYVIAESDQDGIVYRGTSLMDWYIEVGDRQSVGLLKKASPMALWKKNAFASWSEFDEKFGIPFRTVKTPGRDKKRLVTLEQIMKNMGSAGWAILQDDESVEVMQNAGGDVYRCFDNLIDRTNSEMSKLIIGQTMTTDNGSSKSQAQVHLQVLDDIYTADVSFIQDTINWSLMPMLIKHGYNFSADDRIVADLTKPLSRDEQIKTYELLLKYYTIDEQHIGDKFGVPTDMISPRQDNSPANGNFNTPSPRAARTGAIVMQLPDYSTLCTVCGGTADHFKVSMDLTDRINETLMNDSYNENRKFSPDYNQFLIDQFSGSVRQGFSDRLPEIQYDAPDHHMMVMMEANLYRFSAAKNLATLTQLNQLATAAPNFNYFKKQALPVLDQVNGTHLKTEYNFAVNASENAANYLRQVENSDVLPYLEYQTAGDSRVREAHAALDGRVFKIGDHALDYIYPPNGWNCRCHMISQEKPGRMFQADGGSAAIQTLKSDVDSNGQSEWDRMVSGGFAINRGKAGMVFNENQFYVKGNFQENFGVADNGLNKYASIKSQYPALELQEQTPDQAKKWYDDNVGKNGYLVDYNKRPILFSEQTLDRHLTPKYEKPGIEGRQNQLLKTKDIVGSPDEVYFQRDNQSGRMYFRYLKFYSNTTLSVLATLDRNEPLAVSSWYEVPDKTVDINARVGMLVYKKKP